MQSLWGGQLNIGIGLKYIKETLAGYSATTVAADFGALYSLPWTLKGDRTQIGISAQNLGKGLKFKGERSPLPATYRIGLSHTRGMMVGPVTFSVEGAKPRDENMYMGFGMEYELKKTLSLRTGYTSRAKSQDGWRIGMGMKFHAGTALEWGVDYAFAPLGDFGSTHRVNVGVRFGGQKAEIEEAGTGPEETESLTADVAKLPAPVPIMEIPAAVSKAVPLPVEKKATGIEKQYKTRPAGTDQKPLTPQKAAKETKEIIAESTQSQVFQNLSPEQDVPAIKPMFSTVEFICDLMILLGWEIPTLQWNDAWQIVLKWMKVGRYS